MLLEKSLIVSQSLAVEPRFTCTTSWIVAPKLPKNKAIVDPEVENDQQVSIGQEKKQKKRKNSVSIPAVEQPQSKEPKVRFQEIEPLVEVEEKQSKKKKQKKVKLSS